MFTLVPELSRSRHSVGRNTWPSKQIAASNREEKWQTLRSRPQRPKNKTLYKLCLVSCCSGTARFDPSMIQIEVHEEDNIIGPPEGEVALMHWSVISPSSVNGVPFSPQI